MRSKTHKLNSKLVSSQTQKFGYSASVGFVIYEIVFPFTSVTKERTEVIFQGTRNLTVIPDEEGGIWEEYQFKCKPGDPRRRPCLISPYHYRLDWLMWFAAFQVSVRNGSPVRNNISQRPKYEDAANDPNSGKDKAIYSVVAVFFPSNGNQRTARKTQ